jgi:hypothetical protein
VKITFQVYSLAGTKASSNVFTAISHDELRCLLTATLGYLALHVNGAVGLVHIDGRYSVSCRERTTECPSSVDASLICADMSISK